jgi:hypothetical protein
VGTSGGTDDGVAARARWRRLTARAAVVVVVVVAAGLSVFIATGAKPAVQPNHAAYQKLWNGTRVGSSMSSVLARWPSPPYERYTDGAKNRCFEWLDRSKTGHKLSYLYNLCFKNGILATKSLA